MSFLNIHIVSRPCPRVPERRPKAAVLAAIAAALLAGLPFASTAPAAHAQATAPPAAVTLPDPTYKPLLPNTGASATAFNYVSAEKQSPLNPYPNGLGDAQNRARGSSDLYWGILDADISWLSTPLARARVEDLGFIAATSANSIAANNTVSEDYTSLITMDGWTFPRLSSQNGVFFPQHYTNDPNYNPNNLAMQEVTVSAIADGAVSATNSPFAQVQGPSTDVLSNLGGTATYYVATSIPRPANDAVSYDANSKFTWRLDNPAQASGADPTQRYAFIPGTTIGQQVRYRIIIHVPTAPDVQPTPAENRIDDARYVVYYYVYQNGAFVPMQNICIASQLSGGDLELKNLNGSTAFFPFFSSVNFNSAGVTANGLALAPQPTTGTPVVGSTPLLQGITVDNTSGDDVDSGAVLADTITLEPSFDTVSATPTITPPHGGAVVVNQNAATQGLLPSVMIQPKSYLPDLLDVNYNTPPQHYDNTNNIYNSQGPAATVQSFINNIDDTAYAGTAYAAYQPWNVSTVFEGPSSLIDPRYAGSDSSTPNRTYPLNGAQVGLVDPYLTNRPQLDIPADPSNLAANEFILTPGQATNATNNWVYGSNGVTPTATPAPYFSHIQVIVARTEYAQDPNDPSGTSTIQVGAIYALDWQTGTPVWRFPDRSYLPFGATFRGAAIPGAGLRNAVIGSDTSVLGHPQPIFQVPGIVAVDRNGDGVITDNEIYIGTSQAGVIDNVSYVTTTGNLVSGGVFASVTVAPRVLVQGDVQIPVHPTYAASYANYVDNLNSTNGTYTVLPDITSTATSTPGRYSGLAGGGGPTGDYGAVPVGMAFIAAANGCLYAVDAYGNNDTRYLPGTTINNTLTGTSPGGTVPSGTALNGNKFVQPTGLYFGQYLPGTTNLFWSFNAVISGQLTGESTLKYHQRVLAEVPATNSFGSSAPVLAWNYTDSEIADYYAKAGAGYTTPPELRLFVGNTNGVLYALDPTGLTGITIGTNGVPNGTNPLPFIKGAQPLTAAANIAYANTAPITAHQGDLRWWFLTQGAINMAPAVSLIRHNMGAYSQDVNGNAIIEKAVYVGTQEGHMYALDWDGPVTRTPIAHGAFLATLAANAPYSQQGFTAYDGSVTAATNLNNDYYFHNTLPAFTNGIADLTFGEVRPRWTYPNLYFDIGVNGTAKKSTAIPDAAQGVGPNSAEISGIELAASSSLGPIATAPMLMDFWWQDPDTGNPAAPSLVDYVAFVANDPSVVGTPATQSRVYLLDAVGDRVNLLTNPRATPIETTTRAKRRVISQPRDKYSPHVLLASASDPTVPAGLTWTYRYQNDVYESTAAGTPPVPLAQTAFDVQLRNSPFYNVLGTGGVIGSAAYEMPDININTFDPSVWQQNLTLLTGVGANATTTINAYIHQPGRRMLPTLFVGGVGEAYALDIDPETALFMRWRPSGTPGTLGANAAMYQDLFTPLPNRINQGLDPYPGDPTIAVGGILQFGSMAPEDALDPPDHVFDVANNGNAPFGYKRSQLAYNDLNDSGVQLGQLILARYYGLESNDESLITSLTVSGGPMQNRNNIISENGVAQSMPSVPAYPTNDVPNLRPFSVATVTPPTGLYGASVGANPGTTSLNQSATATTNTLDYNGLASNPPTGNAALVPGGHLTGAVNQDINDPVTPTRGRISSLPLSHPGVASTTGIITYPANNPVPAIPNEAFQYPILFATTTGSFLHGISTNIEGEDRQGAQVDGTIVPSEAGDSRPIGWAFLPGNPGRFNADHTQVFLQLGPGGPSGIADMSNVYFPAIDPYALAYRNNATAATGTPYSLLESPNFIADEPNTLPVNNNPATGTPSGPNGVAGGTVQDPDDLAYPQPRPDFKPRPLTAAQLAVANQYPATNADTNTGDTGFPLDLNGLFFDRQFAGAAPALVGVQGVGGATQFPAFINDGFTNVTGYDPLLNYNNDNQFPNGDYHVWLRTPGYSNVGARLISPNNGLNGSLLAAGVPLYGDNNNQIAEGVRAVDLLSGTVGASPFPLHTGSVQQYGDIVSDDINPAGQNVTWIYTGSSNGAVYAFTPSVVGHESGAVGGEGFPFGNTNNNPDGANGGSEKVGIFPASEYAKILNNTFDRNGLQLRTVSALGGKNYYEWGETVYIIVYDLLAEPFGAVDQTTPAGRYQNYVPGLANPPLGGVDKSVTITVTDRTGGTQLTETLSLRGASADGTGALIRYYLDPTTNMYVSGAPASRNVGTPLGIAIYRYTLNNSPTTTKTQTPGSLLQVTVQAQKTIVGGTAQSPATERPGFGVSAENAQSQGIGSYFSIANPLAIQGFLASTQAVNGKIVPLSPQPATGDFSLVNANANTGIGPFEASSDQGYTGDTGTIVKKDDSTTLDPNKAGAEYWQALANGNTIQRTYLNPYVLPLPTDGVTMPTINPRFMQPVITANGITEPAFYFPVMTSPGYVNHGTSGSTAVGTDATTGLTQQYLRIMNRALLPSLAKVRALPVDTPGDLLFRAWPGVLMNDDADPVGTLGAASTNVRNYPTVMDPFGRINPLLWETAPAEAKPWNPSALVNVSPDYPDILTRTNSGTALQIMTASGDLTATPGTLTSIVTPPISATPTNANATANSVNTTVSALGGTPASGNGSGIQGLYGTSLNVRIPRYQPANLAATPNETSTYVNANRADFPGGVTADGGPIIVGTPGPVQMPRGATARLLYTPTTTPGGTSAALAPFGYTAKVVVFIDNDGTNRLVGANSQQANNIGGTNPNNRALGNLTTGGKAYRIFEVWAGVPVDESMKIAESVVDLGAAAHGMGMQNGLLGYGLTGGADNSLLPGFLPPTITNSTLLASPYLASYKPFTIQGTGNVNLYNLRASQKVESNLNTASLTGDGAGSGFPFTFFQLGSGTVDSRFGIMAAGADPLLPGLTVGGTQVTPPNVMPQIVTSIDRTFDADWISLIQANYSNTNSNSTYNAGVGTAVANYYSAAFGGRHPLPKALPNAISPSVFGIPAIPAAQNLTIAGTTLNLSAGVQKPYVGVAVPLGTPVGEYSSATSNSPFSIFEDHDTDPNVPYNPTPGILSGGGGLSPLISAAGPLYNGQNAQYPVSTTGAPLPIFPVNGEGTWRVQSVTRNNSTGQYLFNYLPYTYPYLTVQVKVTESPLTGQFPDFTMSSGGTGAPTTPIVNTGVLPYVDPFPLETPDNVGANNSVAINRPSSALTPASWRDANGNLHVYFARNATAATGTGTGGNTPPYGAKPGAPYKLYSTDLAWVQSLGTWEAYTSPLNSTTGKQGNPLAVTSPATKNTGQWFTPPAQIMTPEPTNSPDMDSDTSPFVLTDSIVNGTSSTVDRATLFYMNTTPTVAGTPFNQIYYVDVTNETNGTAPATPQLYFKNGDPSILRYTPRVAYVKDATNNVYEDFLFYYGGQHGRWSIYYVPRATDNTGALTGTAPDASVTANVETPILVPNSIVSASEPAPVYHQIYDQRLTSATVGALINVIDVYYTGISRATQTPDIYMNRYQVTTQTVGTATTPILKPLALPRIVGEQLSAINHQSLWRAQNIAWVSDLSLKGLNVLPTVYITTNGVTNPLTVDASWQYDPSSNVLYQITGNTPKSLTYVYVDAASGTVRFRGAKAPGATDTVTVDYTPQAYRLTSDGASNFGPYTFTETRNLPVSTELVNGTTSTSGTQTSPLFIRRSQPLPSGRNWLFWQKGATSNTPPTLFSAERRVGVDLGTVVPQNESVQLTVPTTANNYTYSPVSVQIAVALNPNNPTVTTNVTNYEFEFGPSGTGRIYIDPQYEGLPITVTVQTVTANTQGSPNYGANGQTQPRTFTGFARYIDELNYSAKNVIGAAVEVGTGINEGQASAFLDLFDATGINRANPPAAATDPSLTPGRVWLFWSSPRGRLNTGYPNGYNTYWEALAPVFEPPLVATPSSR